LLVAFFTIERPFSRLAFGKFFLAFGFLDNGFFRRHGSRTTNEAPPTYYLGKSNMTEAIARALEARGILAPGFARAPLAGKTSAKPWPDEVIVFHDFFTTGLWFPLDPIVVEIFKLFKVFLHQVTPTSFLRLNIYMWLVKICRWSGAPKGSHASSTVISNRRP
jgi:hypothetical protein